MVGDGMERDDIVDLLTSLVDASMVTVGSTDDRARYSLLETLRQYGAQHLEGRDAEAVRLAHAGHYAAFAEQADLGLRGPRRGALGHASSTGAGQLRVAHRMDGRARLTCDAALRLSRGLRYYMLFRFRDEVVSWGERSLDLPGASSTRCTPRCAVPSAKGLTARGEMARAHGSRRTRAAPPQRPGRPSTDVRATGGGDGLPVRREAGRRLPRARRDAPSRAPARSPLRGRHGSPGSGAVAYLRR